MHEAVFIVVGAMLALISAGLGIFVTIGLTQGWPKRALASVEYPMYRERQALIDSSEPKNKQALVDEILWNDQDEYVEEDLSIDVENEWLRQ